MYVSFQPQFIHLAQIWSGFQDEMVLLSVLSNILVSLEPFTRGHREMYHEDIIIPFLDGVEVRTDEQRLQETMGSEHRVCNSWIVCLVTEAYHAWFHFCSSTDFN